MSKHKSHTVVNISVSFGRIAGLLPWGRAAALLVRCATAVVKCRATRSQCYVDDPIIVSVLVCFVTMLL